MEYNGWTNYETWLVKLWIDNDRSEQEYWLERATDCQSKDNPSYRLADELKNCFTDARIDLPLTGLMADMIGAAFSSVNWDEIALSLTQDTEEIA